jgi:hypothetical protein
MTSTASEYPKLSRIKSPGCPLMGEGIKFKFDRSLERIIFQHQHYAICSRPSGHVSIHHSCESVTTVALILASSKACRRIDNDKRLYRRERFSVDAK